MTREEFTNQKFNNVQYRAILEYIVANASDALWEKIVKSDKNIPDCYMFIAKEILNEGKYIKSGKVGIQDASVDDTYVFGKAIHYFEEESIPKCTGLDGVKVSPTSEVKHGGTNPKTGKAGVVTEKKPKVEKKTKVEEPVNPSYQQTSLFDLLGD